MTTQVLSTQRCLGADIAEDAAAPLPVGTRLQEFEITGLIGIGGFGIVYLAKDLALQRRVAIKEYMPGQLATRSGGETVRARSSRSVETFELGRRSFLNEARLLAQFKHRGLVEVLRFWEQNGTAYMVMPYYEGETLKQFLKRSPESVTQDWVRSMLRPLLDALEHMHAAECFHRDVAPDNILILADGSPILLDLGAARQVIGDHAQALTVMLKPGFAPIEQYAEDPSLKQAAWTDVYALGAVAYFAITGKVPVAAASRVLRDHMSPLAMLQPMGYDDSLLRAIDHAMAIRPEERPRSIAQFRAALFAGSTMEATEARDAVPFAATVAMPAMDAQTIEADLVRAEALAVDGQPAPGKSSRPLVAGIIAAVVALVSIGGWMASRSDSTATQLDQASLLAPAEPAVATMAPQPASAVNAPMTVPPVAVPSTPNVQPSSPMLLADTPFGGSVNAGMPSIIKASTANTATEPMRPPAATSAATDVKQAERLTTGVLRLDVAPWAQVYVDGVSKGVTPPLKQLTLPTGRHTVELRNPAGKPVQRVVKIDATAARSLSHQF